MKTNVVEENQCLPTIEELNRRFRYDAVSGLLYIKNSTNPRTKVGEICGYRGPNGYLRVKINYKPFMVHRVIWAMVHGAWPKEMIDHINGARDDNRLENLRDATCSENLWNQGIAKNNKSGVKGVSWSAQNQKWKAVVKFKRKPNFIGYFNTLEDADAAIREAREKLHGQFARHI